LAALQELQGKIGNRAVTALINRKVAGASHHLHADASGETAAAALVDMVQRQPAVAPAPAPTAGGAPTVPGAPAPKDAKPCPDPDEQDRKDKFRARTDMKLLNHIPSTGIGKFDVSYLPKTGSMPVKVKIHFEFTDAAGAPTGWDFIRRLLRGEDLSKLIWDDTQRKDYISQFTKRVHDRWSGAHTIRSLKPCWDFVAVPDINVVTVDDKAAAHFAVTVHKSPGPNIDYKSAVNNEHLLDPTKQPTADFYQSDNREAPDFNSKSVAINERKRIEGAIRAAGVGKLLFDVNSPDLRPGVDASLKKLAGALNAALPSAPLIPIHVDGFASSDGKLTWNNELAQKRANTVAKVLTDAGVRQPVVAVGKGPVGTPGDASNRAAKVTADRAFENTYTSNRYSVSEHEFGHMLGNPDEYSNAATGTPLGGVQAKYSGLVTSAGLTVPTFGENTSSQMSAGVDVLPEHYVTLWEALAKMTAPDLKQADWSLK
jgi:outer membrane protein OmpA-like peptidoglycan-associated protein